MTSPSPPPGPPRRSLRPRVPAVLRDEPQYRLLFGSQVLSILGDRVTSVVLPFAVLSVGGGVGDVALVSAAQFLPFAVLALPAGVWADRLRPQADPDRLRRGAVRSCQLTAGLLLVTGTRATWSHLVVLAARLRRGRRVLRAGVHRAAARRPSTPVNLQPANALRGLTYSTGVDRSGRCSAGLLVAFAGGPGRRAPVRRRDLRGLGRLPDPAAARGWSAEVAARRGPGGHDRPLPRPA